jgi:hypothetical protein
MSQKLSEVCKSRNEEPLHWRRVRELHRTNYDLKEKFVVPAVAPAVAEPATSSSSPVSSVANSPVKPAKVNSVVVSVRVYVGKVLIFS